MTDQTTPILELGMPIVLAFSHQRIADMVTTAIESKVGDWLQRATISIDLRNTLDRGQPWYSQAKLYTNPDVLFTALVESPESDCRQMMEKPLRMEDFQRALILMATKDDGAYARHFGDLLGNNEDALTADLFMQLAVYGEEVYA